MRDPISEIADLLPQVSLEDVQAAWASAFQSSAVINAFQSPAPPVSPVRLKALYSELFPLSPGTLAGLSLMFSQACPKPYLPRDTTPVFQLYNVGPNGTMEGFLHDPSPWTLHLAPNDILANRERIFRNLAKLATTTTEREFYEERARSLLLQRLLQGEKSTKDALKPAILEKLLKVFTKLGVPKQAERINTRAAARHNMSKSWTARFAIKTAMASGACWSAGISAVFDAKLLWDRKFADYLTRVAISGLYGATTSGLSTWLKNPWLKNNMVVNVFVGSAFNTVNLVSTGDWERFGKDISGNVVRSGGAWAGSSLGAAAGAFGGPVGAACGALIGALIGSTVGSKGAEKVLPWLKELTEREYRAAYEKLKETWAGFGLEPAFDEQYKETVDYFILKRGSNETSGPSVRFRPDIQKAIRELQGILSEMNDIAPQEFTKFVELLRAAANGRAE